MSERAQKVVGGKLVPRQPQVSEDAPALPDAAMAWTGTSLSTALANAQAAEARPADAEGAGASAAGARGAAEGAGGWTGEAADAGGGGTAEASGAEFRSGARAARGVGSDTQSGNAGDVLGGGRRSGARGQANAKSSGGASSKATHAFAATRAVARKLALQAIYRWLLNDAPWQDLVKEFGEAEDMPNADPQYFRALVEGVWDSRKSLDERLAELVDRPVAQLDPVEHAVLLVGLYELSARPDVPYRVVINEAVGLAKRFGATDGHKFVNAVLDRAARTLRPGED
jgi:N utilization substance protein B